MPENTINMYSVYVGVAASLALAELAWTTAAVHG